MARTISHTILVARLTALHTNLGRACEDAEAAMAVADDGSEDLRVAKEARDDAMRSRRSVADLLAGYGVRA